MFLLGKPNNATVEGFFKFQTNAELSYRQVGLTREGRHPERGYHVDIAKSSLGHGEEVFESAVKAMKAWRHFDLNWIYVYPEGPELKTENRLVIYAKVPPFWTMNANKIVYVIDEASEASRRFGYGYGTLADHAEEGEERFLIEWNRSTNEVVYEILAFSRPHQFLAVIGKLLTLYYQDKFRRDSVAALTKAVQK